jgi:cytochrome c-type biogenesis protein
MNILIAFGGGLLAFLSPCFLPLVPAYLIYITGLTLDEVKNLHLKTFLHSLIFVLGFTLIFSLLGLTASLIGSVLFDFKEILRIIGGALLILFGLYLAGIVKLPFLDLEKKLTLSNKPAGYFGSFLVGIVFALSWSPCVGPILAGILAYAAQSETAWQGIAMLIAFSFGLGLPLILMASAVNYSIGLVRKIERYLGIIHYVSGLFLILVGVLLMTNYFQSIAAWLIELTGYKGI